MDFIIDSSVFVSSCLEEEFSSYSRELMKEVWTQHKRIIIPWIIVFEAVQTLRRSNFNDLYEIIHLFNEHKFVKMVHLDQELLFEFLAKDHILKLKTSDAIIATASYIYDANLVTWDKNLLKVVKHSFTPKEWLNK